MSVSALESVGAKKGPVEMTSPVSHETSDEKNKWPGKMAIK
jgi:hypothetical protein